MQSTPKKDDLTEIQDTDADNRINKLSLSETEGTDAESNKTSTTHSIKSPDDNKSPDKIECRKRKREARHAETLDFKNEVIIIHCFLGQILLFSSHS